MRFTRHRPASPENVADDVMKEAFGDPHVYWPLLERLIARAVADAYERCAQIADGVCTSPDGWERHAYTVARDIASRIRELGGGR